jgi:uncharacterized protein (UPF0335 family)
MTHPAKEAGLDVGSRGIKGGLSVSAQDALAALDQLAQRIERLRTLLVQERNRVAELEDCLKEAEGRGRAVAEGTLKKQLQRLQLLDEEKKHWDRERSEVLRIVEGLIRKVDSLEKQL